MRTETSAGYVDVLDLFDEESIQRAHEASIGREEITAWMGESGVL